MCRLMEFTGFGACFGVVDIRQRCEGAVRKDGQPPQLAPELQRAFEIELDRRTVGDERVLQASLAVR